MTNNIYWAQGTTLTWRDSGGDYAITLRADNGLVSSSRGFTLRVVQPRAITSAAAVAFAVGVDNTFTVRTTGFPHPAIGLAPGDVPPAWLGLVDNGDYRRVLSGRELCHSCDPAPIRGEGPRAGGKPGPSRGEVRRRMGKGFKQRGWVWGM